MGRSAPGPRAHTRQLAELQKQLARSATQEQATGIGQVGDAVAQLDQVTQQNAALVEQSAATTASLRLDPP